MLEQHEEQLEMLSQSVQAEVTALLLDVVARLAEVAPELAASLTPTDPQPIWSKAFSNLQFEDENGVPLAKRGSGTRRLVLLSFFRATAEKGIEEDVPETGIYRRGVITAVEEPETALHADLQADIIAALQDVGELPHRQVLLTTHSSNLIRLIPAKSIRYITGEKFSCVCVSVQEDGDATNLLAELNKSLGVFTDHNVRCFVLIEGRNDVVGLKNLTRTLSLNSAHGVRSFASLEEAGLISFMPIGGGGNASLWASNLSPFRRDEVHIMDCERSGPTDSLKGEMTALIARADARRHVYVLARREMENYLTDGAILDVYSHIGGFAAVFAELHSSRGDWNFQDIPALCAETVHAVNSTSGVAWGDLSDSTRKDRESRAKKTLASAFSHASVAASLEVTQPDLMVSLRHITSLTEAGK